MSAGHLGVFVQSSIPSSLSFSPSTSTLHHSPPFNLESAPDSSNMETYFSRHGLQTTSSTPTFPLSSISSSCYTSSDYIYDSESPIDSHFLQVVKSTPLRIDSPLPHLRVNSMVPSLCQVGEDCYRDERGAGGIKSPPVSILGATAPSMSNYSVSSGEVGTENSVDVMEIFLDRDPTSYEAIFSWIRDGVLPARLSISLPSSTSASSSSVPPVDPTLLALFVLSPSSLIGLVTSLKSLSLEAAWLGMHELVNACEEERLRVQELAKWVQKNGGQRRNHETLSKEGWF